jgi:hypothetical protein
MEKEFSSKWTPKEGRSSYTHILQNRLQIKISQNRQRSHYINKWNNPSIPQGEIKNCKHIDTISFINKSTTGHRKTDSLYHRNSK